MVRLVVGYLFFAGCIGWSGCRSRQERWWEERERSLRIADAMYAERRARELASAGKVLATIACRHDQPVTIWVDGPVGERRSLLVLQPGARRQAELASGELERLVCLAAGDRLVAYRCVRQYTGNYCITIGD